MAKGAGPFYLLGEVYLFEVGEGNFYVTATAREAVVERYREFQEVGIAPPGEFARLVPPGEEIALKVERHILAQYGVEATGGDRTVAAAKLPAREWAARLAVTHKRRGYPLRLGRPLLDLRRDPRAAARRARMGLGPLATETARRRAPCRDCEGSGIMPVHPAHQSESRDVQQALLEQMRDLDRPEWQPVDDWANGWRYVTCPTCGGKGHA